MRSVSAGDGLQAPVHIDQHLMVPGDGLRQIAARLVGLREQLQRLDQPRIGLLRLRLLGVEGAAQGVQRVVVAPGGVQHLPQGAPGRRRLDRAGHVQLQRLAVRLLRLRVMLLDAVRLRDGVVGQRDLQRGAVRQVARQLKRLGPHGARLVVPLLPGVGAAQAAQRADALIGRLSGGLALQRRLITLDRRADALGLAVHVAQLAQHDSDRALVPDLRVNSASAVKLHCA